VMHSAPAQNLIGGSRRRPTVGLHCKMKAPVRWTHKNYTPDLTPGTVLSDRQHKSDLC